MITFWNKNNYPSDTGIIGSCRNDCPGVREVQVGIGFIAGTSAFAIAG